MDRIEYPVILKDIDKFENQNPTISITVLGYERKIVYPLRNSDNTDREHNIILILIEEGGVNHYCLVKNVSRLLSSQVSNHIEKHHFCLRCLNAFWTHKSLNKHLEYCKKHKAVKIELLEEGTILKFINCHRGKGFLLSSMPTLSVLSYQYNHATQIIKKVILKNIKSTNQLVFLIILNVLMIMYFSRT